MYELLFLLLPVAALSGWFIGRKAWMISKPATNPEAYYAGINYLLSDQSDAALKVFDASLNLNENSIDTHLSLGSLFCRRGEVQRAINIHQQILAHPKLTKEQRGQAILELGRDYFSAGVFDRAEKLFLELIAGKQKLQPSHKYLIDIYQQEKEWEKAIVQARALELATGDYYGNLIAHYYCQLAEQHRDKGDFTKANNCLQFALNCNRNSVRASMLLAESAMKLRNYKKALKSYKRIRSQDIRLLSEVLEPLEYCFRELGQVGEYEIFLKDCLRFCADPSLLLSLARLQERKNGPAAAVELLEYYLTAHPSIEGLMSLLAFLPKPSHGTERQHWQLIQSLLTLVRDQRLEYQCHNCGLGSTLLHWLCPRCKTWDSTFPVAIPKEEKCSL